MLGAGSWRRGMMVQVLDWESDQRLSYATVNYGAQGV